MGFFEEPEVDDDVDDDADPSYGLFVPAVFAIERILVRNERAAITLSAVAIYPDGFELHLLTTVRSQRSRGPTNVLMLRDPVEPSTPAPPSEAELPLFDDDDDDFDQFALEHDLRVGVLLSDGRRLVQRHDFTRGDPLPTAGLEDVPWGPSHVNRARWFFVWPFPEGDAVDVVVAWPMLDLPETSTAFDITPWRAARNRSRPLFDGQPDDRSRGSRTLRFWRWAQEDD